MSIIHANFRKPVSFHGNAQVVHFPRVNQRTGESPTLAVLAGIEVKHETISRAEAQRLFGWMGRKV